MTIKIEITGGDYHDILTQLGASRMGAQQSIEDLLEELRSRLRPQGLVVIVATDDDKPADVKEVKSIIKEATGELVSIVEPKKRGRPRLTEEEKAARGAAKEPDVETAMVVAEVAAKANGGAQGPTRDDVIIALNKYAESHGGQAAGRGVMQKVCGVTRLVDCTPDDYPRLLEALGA